MVDAPVVAKATDGAGLSGPELREASGLTHRLYQAFLRYEATILEVNPLVLTTDGKVVPAAVNEADPYRGTARYTELEGGDIGFLCGGGGGSLGRDPHPPGARTPDMLKGLAK